MSLKNLEFCKYFLFIPEVILDYQMAGRLDSLESYMGLLTTKLQQQEQRNSELVAALTQQEQQRNNEKTAFVKAVGVLQGAVTQLANRVDVIPKMLDKEKKDRYKQYLTSSINTMSEKIGELGNRLSRERDGQIQVRDTRSQTAGELLGKLLGKDLEKALEGITAKNSKNNNGETKDISSSVAPMAPAASVVATNTQPLIPIDLLPQSHTTSLSTPTGQGPAGSASTNPVLSGLSYAQVPSQTNIPAPSTPTGSGPVGSVNTMPMADILPQPQTVSLTSVASKFKPPVNVAGYNVLPLATPAAIQSQALEPPGIITAQPDLPPLLNPGQTFPGAVNPYEVLTSAQMQPKIVQPVGFNGAAPLPGTTSQIGNPYEVLTTAQVRPFGQTMTKGKVMQHDNLGKKGKIRKTSRYKNKQNDEAAKQLIKEVTDKEMGKWKKLGKEKVKKSKKLEKIDIKKISTKLTKDPLGRELQKALKIGNLKKVEDQKEIKKKRS